MAAALESNPSAAAMEIPRRERRGRIADLLVVMPFLPKFAGADGRAGCCQQACMHPFWTN
jgi:hypothetical protein